MTSVAHEFERSGKVSNSHWPKSLGGAQHYVSLVEGLLLWPASAVGNRDPGDISSYSACSRTSPRAPGWYSYSVRAQQLIEGKTCTMETVDQSVQMFRATLPFGICILSCRRAQTVEKWELFGFSVWFLL
ncbi:hypothetical protein H6P81_001069 [Aristolochia fimbriata]|uniref:Uncharacterized protein n=1 Tax=Aristolochia fimbriata TaxID=158543 RepID=A0AAV7F746_ARIFI|nr:hypothetical protein H6P81_001069 [Aristolochia fimbriata]